MAVFIINIFKKKGECLPIVYRWAAISPVTAATLTPSLSSTIIKPIASSKAKSTSSPLSRMVWLKLRIHLKLVRVSWREEEEEG